MTIGEIKNLIEASKDTPAQWQEKSVCIDQRIPDLADTYKQSLFRDRVPFPRKEPTGEMPNESMSAYSFNRWGHSCESAGLPHVSWGNQHFTAIISGSARGPYVSMVCPGNDIT